MGFFYEMKRRNVFRVAVAYLITAWLLIQLADVLIPMLMLPDWVPRFIVLILLILFVPTLIAAWALELTPDGLKLEKNVKRHESITPVTGKKISAITIGLLALAVLVLLFDKIYLSNSRPSADTQVTDKSVAVLPFTDLSEKQDQEWFADGLTEEILNSLSSLPELKVIARTSSFQFKNTSASIDTIADRLGVAHIVEGSVRRIGNQLRVTAKLIRAHDGLNLWSDTYERTTEDLFEVQSEVAENIAITLDVFLDDEKRWRMEASGTRNVAAFEAFIRGRDLFNKAHKRNVDSPSLAEASSYLELAMDLDPGFSQPAIMHSDRYIHYLMEGPVPLVGKTPGLNFQSAPALISRDFRMAASNAPDEITGLIAKIHEVFFSPHWHRLPGLIERLRILVEQGEPIPTDTVWLDEILALAGEIGLAETFIRNRFERDPLSGSVAGAMAMIQARQGHFESATQILRASRRTAGDSGQQRNATILIAMLQENYQTAIEFLNEDFEYSITYRYLQPLMLALQGDEVGAARLADEISDKFEWPNYYMLLVFAKIGDTDRANALAARIDALPLGHSILGANMGFSFNALWFDLNCTPNFKKRLEEAQIDPSTFLSWKPIDSERGRD